ncbi:MAG: PilZ domain-containing protein [Alphaproteobacteria bacterium]|nr:MAG: PilZ domain-containing protein [Alphaproteobacteria bacterium]
MASNRRKSIRRTIAYRARIFASDGSWDMDCRVLDVSHSGAKLAVEQPAKLPQAFILALSMQGNATRRCRLVWTTEREIGVRFERSPAAHA